MIAWSLVEKLATAESSFKWLYFKLKRQLSSGISLVSVDRPGSINFPNFAQLNSCYFMVHEIYDTTRLVGHVQAGDCPFLT